MKKIYRSWLNPWLLATLLFSVTTGQTARADYDFPSAEVFQTVDVPGSWFSLHPGELQTLYIAGGWRFVKKLYIRADAEWGDATLEVIANGDVKGTVFVPGRDPNYVVTVGESVQTLQFRHVSGATIHVRGIQAVQSARCGGSLPPIGGVGSGEPLFPPGHSDLPSVDYSTRLSNQAIYLVERLRDYTDPQSEYVQYLLPVKMVAGRAYSIAAAEGDLSKNTRVALLALAKQIAFIKPLTDELMKKDGIFDLVVRLMKVEVEIEYRLHEN